MPPCPPAASLPGGAGTPIGRGSVIQAAAAVAAAAAAAAANGGCYQPNGVSGGAGGGSGGGGGGGGGSGGGGVVTSPANLSDLYYMDFGAPSAAAAAAAAMYGHHQKAAIGNGKGCSKKPKKYNTSGIGKPATIGSPGSVQQSPPCATGPKRKSREGKRFSILDHAVQQRGKGLVPFLRTFTFRSFHALFAFPVGETKKFKIVNFE